MCLGRWYSGDDMNMDFLATGIGSVPFVDTELACEYILDKLPQAPFWPQMVRLNPREDMLFQFSEGVVFIEVDPDERRISICSTHIELRLAEFYSMYLNDDIDGFRISPEYASGLHMMISMLEQDTGHEGKYVKGQIIGPVTLASGIRDSEGRVAITNPDILDAIVKAISLKALWQIKALKKTGRNVILFLDEPSLSGFGSAFSPIKRDQVILSLKEIFEFLRLKEKDILLGIHCCGNTDWSMIMESGPDIVNFDAYDYMEHFLLYSQDIKRFISDGGKIAWGIVPTSSFKGTETLNELKSSLNSGLKRLVTKGIDPEELRKNSFLTPACGMATMEEQKAIKVLALLSELSAKMGRVENR
jgi:methionine synthase II (cobalamin-independent)